MARGTKTKSKGISLEELMQAQERMMGAGELSEKQLEIAKQQLSKLDTIAKAAVVNDLQMAKEDSDIRKIVARRAVPGSVGLVDVKNEIKNLSSDLKRQLPKFLQEKGQGGKKNAEEKSLTEAERNERLNKLAEVIGEKVKLQKGGSLNETLTGKNRGTFEQFIKETEQRDSLLAEANKDQREIFQQIEDTLIKLQEAGSEESKDLRKELERLRGAMEQTADSGAKKSLMGLAERTSENAAVGVRGNQGSFGDALKALFGRREVLKSGMSRNASGDIVNDKGEKVDAKDAVMGRVAGAGSILGNMMLEKFERGFEDKRTEKTQNFLDNFRSSETRARPNILQGQQNQIMGRGVKVEARAKGGPIVKGRPYLVGEKGPELIVPKNDGQVNPLPKAEVKENAMFSDAGTYRADDASGPFAKGADKIVKAIKDLGDRIENMGGLGGGGINPLLAGPRPTPAAGTATAAAAGSGVMAAGVLGGTALVGAGLVYGTYSTMKENKVVRDAVVQGLTGPGGYDEYGIGMMGQAMTDQEEFEALPKEEQAKITKQREDSLQQKREALKDAPWYTRWYGIGEKDYLSKSQSIQAVPKPNNDIANKSSMNQDLKSGNSAPIVINAPQVVNQQQSNSKESVMSVVRAPVRPEDNAFNNYMNRIYNAF